MGCGGLPLSIIWWCPSSICTISLKQLIYKQLYRWRISIFLLCYHICVYLHQHQLFLSGPDPIFLMLPRISGGWHALWFQRWQLRWWRPRAHGAYRTAGGGGGRCALRKRGAVPLWLRETWQVQVVGGAGWQLPLGSRWRGRRWHLWYKHDVIIYIYICIYIHIITLNWYV